MTITGNSSYWFDVGQVRRRFTPAAEQYAWPDHQNKRDEWALVADSRDCEARHPIDETLQYVGADDDGEGLDIEHVWGLLR